MTWGVPRPRPPLLDDAAFQVPALNVPALPPMAMAVQQSAPKPKFFGQGGIGRTIAGLIGDVLLQRGGNNPMFAPAMAAQRQVALEDAQEQRKAEIAERMRQQGRLESREDKQWEWTNKPEPAPQPIGLEREYEAIARIAGPEAAQRYIANRAEGPPIIVPHGDGTASAYPRSAIVAPKGAAPPPRVGEVVAGRPYLGGDPSKPESWGPPVQGGAGPQAPRGFR